MKLLKKLFLIILLLCVVSGCSKNNKTKVEKNTNGEDIFTDGIYDGNEWSVHYNSYIFDVDNTQGIKFVSKTNENNCAEISYQKDKEAWLVIEEMINELVLDEENSPALEIKNTKVITNKGEHDALFVENSDIEDGVGEYRQILAFDYNDNTVSFFVKQTMTGDEISDTKMSDAFSYIIDSFEFK